MSDYELPLDPPTRTYTEWETQEAIAARDTLPSLYRELEALEVRRSNLLEECTVVKRLIEQGSVNAIPLGAELGAKEAILISDGEELLREISENEKLADRLGD